MAALHLLQLKVIQNTSHNNCNLLHLKTRFHNLILIFVRLLKSSLLYAGWLYLNFTYKRHPRAQMDERNAMKYIVYVNGIQ